MLPRLRFAVVALVLGSTAAHAQAQEPSDSAKGMVGAWEISNAARDKPCPLIFQPEAVTGGFKLEFDPACGTDFPALKDVRSGPSARTMQYGCSTTRARSCSTSTRSKSHMFEAERKGEGLFFMRTQAAIKAATVSPEQLFGEWTLLREFEKPLCKLTLSNVSGGEESYRLMVKPGCAAPHAIMGLGLTTWRLEVNDLLLSRPRRYLAVLGERCERFGNVSPRAPIPWC